VRFTHQVEIKSQWCCRRFIENLYQ